MAILHQAELRPSKLELIGGWAPSQPWFSGDAEHLDSVGAYRFDDPAGEVGVETILVRSGGGPTFQVPLTYRATPLPDADEWLIGTLQHSVLGTRWVYDGVGDPVYLQTVGEAVIAAGDQAELFIEVDGQRVQREPTARVTGSGITDAVVPDLPLTDGIVVRAGAAETVVETGSLRMTVRRVIGGDAGTGQPADGTLTGTWVDQAEPRPLVFVSLT